MIKKENSVVSVNLSAIGGNVRQLKKHVASGVKVMAVIKADAYGHGAVEVAGALEGLVEAFAVNELAEAVELRKAGITLPVLVFAVPEKATAQAYSDYKITATVSAIEHFDRLPAGTSYHLNFDTGMGRLGFQPQQAEEIASKVKEEKELICTGLYTHFATADNPNSEHVYQQQRVFRQLRNHFAGDIQVHITNTGGSVFYDTSEVDMIRLGVGIYGYSPGETEIAGLQPTLHWKTRLVQVRELAKGTTISYGARWSMPEQGHLATIPVGYDDGISRRLTGNLNVRIKGKSYPVVGTITMNYCMVYLGDDYYETGTTVELLHSEQNALHWARKLGTIPYEILTGINPRIPRIYTT